MECSQPQQKEYVYFCGMYYVVDKIKVTLYLFAIIEQNNDYTTFDMKNVGQDECAWCCAWNKTLFNKCDVKKVQEKYIDTFSYKIKAPLAPCRLGGPSSD